MDAVGWYRSDLRVSICSRCGAVVEAPRGPGGAGAFRQQPGITAVCSCGTEIVLPERPPVPRAAPISEQTRLQRLIEQDDRIWATPPGLEPFEKQGGGHVEAMATEWRRVRAAVDGEADGADSVNRLLWLTMHLRNTLARTDARRRVAFTSAALDVVTGPRHRQTLMSWLVLDAARAGELGAAEELLELCDPRPVDLWADTAYRIARAWIDTLRGNHFRVLELLGERAEDVPTADHSDDLAAFLRANALEQTGKKDLAVHGLARMMAAGGQEVVTRIQAKNPEWCRETFPAAVARVETMAKESRRLSMGRAMGRGFYGKIAQPLGVMFAVVSLGGIGAAIGDLPVLGLDRAALAVVGLVTGSFAFVNLRFGGFTRRATAHEQRLRREGVRADARIIGAQPTGVEVNGRSQMKMAMVVKAPDHVPFRTFHVELAPPGEKLETGRTVPVIVDSKDPGDLVIDWGPKAAGGWFRPRVLLWAVVPFMVFGLGGFIGSCMGYEPAALERLNACPRATELLGSPIERGYLGLSCGSAETGGGSGQASWTMPVVGPKGRGSYSFHMEQHGGPWQLLQGELEAGDVTVDVVNCSLAAGGQGVRTTRTVAGKVTAAVGLGPAPVGSECTVEIGPGGGSFGCRVRVGCGGRMLYGATETTGFVPCRVETRPDGTEVVSAQDTAGTAGDSDPILDVRESAGEVVVSDQSPTGTWAITITLR